MSIRTVLVLDCDICLDGIDNAEFCYKIGHKFVCRGCLCSLSRWLWFLGMEETKEQIYNTLDNFPGGMDGIEMVRVNDVLKSVVQ